ncbi:MAG: hypothetical protein WAN69_07575 [Candidatus Korobacteraceae bacterium]
MQRSRLREVPADLSGVAERLERWRQGRKRGDRIPATLWVEAAELASRYGVNRTARTLGLDYYHLKKRVKTSSRTGPRKSAADVRFEELPASAFAAPLECVIQFENSAGARLRIEWRGNTAPDVAALGRDFWGVG